MSSGFHLKAGNFNINKYGAADDYSEEQLFFSEKGKYLHGMAMRLKGIEFWYVM